MHPHPPPFRPAPQRPSGGDWTSTIQPTSARHVARPGWEEHK
ncbi:MAG: hypothetical protein Q8P67_15320 [archaeon]|nr:hypothetical protein [archaeon]